jgi:hypothetical protein
MEAGRVEAIAGERAAPVDLEPHELAIQEIVRKSVEAPALLCPDDLLPLLRTLGRIGTLEVTAMLVAFHFINRMADLVGIRSDIPLIAPDRWRTLWSLGVRVQGFALRRVFDFSNQAPEGVDADAILDKWRHIRKAPLPPGYEAVRESPGVAAWLGSAIQSYPLLDPAMVERVNAGVHAALPSCREEARGFHRRPEDPFDALVFVGTRYPARTTDETVEELRRQYSWGDPEITDFFYAIAMANCFERLDRLWAAPLPSL